MLNIGITVRHELTEDVNFNKKLSVPLPVVDVLEHMGATVLLLTESSADVLINLCDGLVLTGSSIDIDPYYWGQSERITSDIDEFATDKRLIENMRARRKPVFGICGGLQSLNVAMGGSLKRIEGHRDTEHMIHMCSECEYIRPDFIGPVNSFHNWSIDRPGSDIQIIAVDGDSIEAAMTHDRLCFGIQWHPEEMTTGNFQRYMYIFLRKCRSLSNKFL